MTPLSIEQAAVGVPVGSAIAISWRSQWGVDAGHGTARTCQAGVGDHEGVLARVPAGWWTCACGEVLDVISVAVVVRNPVMRRCRRSR
ncbi:hypothetical protein CFP66_26335 [Pseudonocardia sp. MH-G8]|nr:hypothetical protein CFP66_26335 [Pseudonocardia sp. MH-G8]